MAIRVITLSPIFVSDNGSINSPLGVTREINLLKNPPTEIVYTPIAPPTVGQAWPRGNV